MAASSPAPSGDMSLEEELAYYKKQYEYLERELAEFQESSRELESQLEKDIEGGEKRERKLKEKVEGLGYEVEEWKTKCKQAKTESNSAQNTLQKEVTTLRDQFRSLQLKLRDMEVANDDFERQARNTTSSLDDLESKYNQALERGVMLEEEVKQIEQEREHLRVEKQRLHDELTDHKIESEIVAERLRKAEEAIAQNHAQKTTQFLAGERPRSPMSETSTSVTTLSSPADSTPPPSKLSAASSTPPSPPLSEGSALPTKLHPHMPAPRKTSVATDSNLTPRPSNAYSRRPRHSRGPSAPITAGLGNTTPSERLQRRVPSSAPRNSNGRAPRVTNDKDLPRQGSLYQIRGLIGKMQKLEQRVHTVRSKLPAPVSTPPRASPRNNSALSNHSGIPSSVTVRSGTRKRSSATTTSSAYDGRRSVSRLSFGVSQGAGNGRPPSTNPSNQSRPTSQSSNQRSDGGLSKPQYASATMGRPVSRAGARTPLSGNSLRRPRSSISGRGGPEGEEETDLATPLPRRTTMGEKTPGALSAIPMPSGLPRRMSGGGARRPSGFGLGDGDMKPPPKPKEEEPPMETF